MALQDQHGPKDLPLMITTSAIDDYNFVHEKDIWKKI